MVKPQAFLVPTRSVFNRIVGDQGFELAFAEFLDSCPEVVSFAKNDLALGFKLDYAKANGDHSNDYPDFIVKLSNGTVVIVETIDDFAFVDEAGFQTYRPKSFSQILNGFKQYKASTV